MGERLDPRHDRVVLTQDELRVLARLERAVDQSYGKRSDSVDKLHVRMGVRAHVLSACLWWMRIGPWLVPIGIGVMLAALSSSLVISALGVFITALGLAACARRPWVRAPIAHLRKRSQR